MPNHNGMYWTRSGAETTHAFSIWPAVEAPTIPQPSDLSRAEASSQTPPIVDSEKIRPTKVNKFKTQKITIQTAFPATTLAVCNHLAFDFDYASTFVFA